MSVIVPVCNNARGVAALLGELAKQDLSQLDCVIIVENGSRSVSIPTSFPVGLKYYNLPVASRAIARNFGATKVTTEFLAFIDSDVLPQSGWLSALISHFDEQTLAVQSELIPTSTTYSRITYLLYLYSFYGNNRSFLSLNRLRGRGPIIDSAAFAVRTSVFKEVGGFDEVLKRHEDCDFSWRLMALEGKLVGVKGVGCGVSFDGNLFDYLCREVCCGFHVVHLLKKWGRGGFLTAARSLVLKCLAWVIDFSPRTNPVPLKWELQMLTLCQIIGSFAGLLCYAIFPSVQRQQFIRRAKVIVR